ncbi:MAG: acyltransferase [Pseudomonadota bacterium]
MAEFENLSFGDQFATGMNCIFENADGPIAFGHRVAINHNVFIGSDFGSIVIDDDVVIGPGVIMRAANHTFDLDDDRPIRDQGHVGGEIRVDSGAWIAAHVTLLVGAHVGAGAVVGAGSVVVGAIPAHSLAVGAPARIIRQRGG